MLESVARVARAGRPRDRGRPGRRGGAAGSGGELSAAGRRTARWCGRGRSRRRSPRGSPRWPGSCAPSQRWPSAPGRAGACGSAARTGMRTGRSNGRRRRGPAPGRRQPRLAGRAPRPPADRGRAGRRATSPVTLPLQRSYWMVVAAATTLRPEFGATFTRGTERALGTCLGVGLAGAIAVALHPAGGVTIAHRRAAGLRRLRRVRGQLRGRVRLHHRAWSCSC